jgi:hypothetical protein
MLAEIKRTSKPGQWKNAQILSGSGALRSGKAMNSAVLHLTIVSKRMLTLQEAAQHCGRSVKRFEIECPASPVIFPNGDRRFDVHDLDKWLDSFKRGDDDIDAIVGRLGNHDRRAS